MELYTETDINVFKTNIGDVLTKIENLVLEEYAPTKAEMIQVQQIILDFIKKKKRIMYGGTALHLAIIEKNISGSFYKSDELFLHDLDIYSPDPIHDIVNICNILHKKKYKQVYAREAIHNESYSITVHQKTYCDISYVPNNIFNKLPYMTINGFMIAHPYFMTIDYLKIFIDPILAANFRWEKAFERYYALQKYYPLPHSTTIIELDLFGPKMTKYIYEKLSKWCENNNTIIVTGFMAYNLYYKISQIQKPYITSLEIPYIECISIDYINDVLKIINLLMEIDKTKVSIIEYYPFFTFTNFRTDILFDGRTVIRIYENLSNLCTPYILHNNIIYGTFQFNLRMCICNAIISRVFVGGKMESVYYAISSHLIQMRKYYLDNTNQTFFSETVFKDFVYKCIGFTQNARIDKEEEFAKSKRIAFKYNPQNPNVDYSRWDFVNSSGQPIKNNKNYKIKFDANTKDIHVA